MKTTTFSLTNLTDSDLSRLLVDCQREQTRREQYRQSERKKWVDERYYAFLGHPNATSIQVGETTVVALYHRYYGGIRIGKATPIHGDKFNREVGIAVAYAKAIGEEVPYYI
jgi:hypothetical protein